MDSRCSDLLSPGKRNSLARKMASVSFLGYRQKVQLLDILTIKIAESIKTASGLEYIEVEAGTGAQAPAAEPTTMPGP